MSRQASLDLLRSAFDRARPAEVPGPAREKAAVAAVLRERRDGLELLFIRRAEHPSDPWSGHMGLPGGRVDATDPSPLEAAIRETQEELGLDLARTARPLGRLSEVRTHLRDGGLPKSVVPFGFALEADADPAFVLNHEVAEALWVPLGFLADPGRRETLAYDYGGVPISLPCCRFQGRTIWGLTFWIVEDLLRLAAAPAGG